MDYAYVVLKEEEAIFASRMEEIAEAYVEYRKEKCINQVCEDWEEDLEDADEVKIGETAFRAGQDEQPPEVYKIDLSEYVEGDTIEFDDGSEIQYDYICNLLDESKHICIPDQLIDYFDDGYDDNYDDEDYYDEDYYDEDYDTDADDDADEDIGWEDQEFN